MTVADVYVPLSLSIENRKKMIESFKNLGWEDSGFIPSGKSTKDYPPIPLPAAYKFIWNRFGKYALPNNLPEGYRIEFLEM